MKGNKGTRCKWMEEICNSLKTKHIRRIYEKSKALFPCVFVVIKALVKNRENQAKRLWKHSRTIRVSPAFSFSKTFTPVFTTLWKFREHLLLSVTLLRFLSFPKLISHSEI